MEITMANLFDTNHHISGGNHAMSSLSSDPGIPVSALSQIHPDHAGELARFLAVEAGWTTADLHLLDGDPEFTAEVKAAMRHLRPVS